MLRTLNARVTFRGRNYSTSVVGCHPSNRQTFCRVLCHAGHSLGALVGSLSLVSIGSSHLLHTRQFRHFVGRRLGLARYIRGTSSLKGFTSSFSVCIDNDSRVLGVRSGRCSKDS